jgi:hypothetical protein
MREFLLGISREICMLFSLIPRIISREIGEKYYNSPARIKVESKSVKR